MQNNQTPAPTYLAFLTQSRDDVFRALKTQADGLTPDEVRARLAAVGPNTLPRKRTNALKVFFRQFANPFVYLLIAAIAVAIFLGEVIDAITIMAILLVNGALGFIEEFRAERTLEKLENFLVPLVRVRRAGTIVQVRAHEIVPGDLLPLEAGDVAVADLRVIESQALQVDESVLTGESVEVTKNDAPLARVTSELSEAANTVFAGTKVITGRATGVVVATGAAAVFGGIAHEIHHIERKSGFEDNLKRFSSFMLRIVVVTIIILFAANWLLKRHGVDIPELLLFVIALALSVVPEALPVVTTVALGTSAARLAKRNVVVRRLSALEDLGNIDILCTDKTGTITENNMRVTAIAAADRNAFLQAASFEIAWQAMHAPGGVAGTGSFDRALWAEMDEKKMASPDVVWDFPFDPAHRVSVIAVRDGGAVRMIVRGAPEEIVARAAMPDAEKKNILAVVAEAGSRGERALALASRALAPGESPSLDAARDLAFLGYATLEDPLKPTAAAAIATARELNIDIRIITGDSAEVAFAVGLATGLVKSKTQVATAAELWAMSEDERAEAIRRTTIYARVSPEQKLLIIKTLQEHHSVGFLGEGVNDAPALELANVALVVDNATAVAREAADVVLLEKDLTVMVRGIEDGRKIFENISKYLKYTLVGNFGNFYTLATITLILPFVPLLPAQILLTNLLTDLPLIAISFDRVAREDVISPRPFVVRRLILFALFLGLVSSVFDFLFFGMFWHTPAPMLRTLWFLLSSFTDLAVIFSIRTRRAFFAGPAPAFSLLLLALGVAVLTLALPYISWAERVFHFVPPTGAMLAVLGIITVAYFFASEGMKLLFYRWIKNSPIQ